VEADETKHSSIFGIYTPNSAIYTPAVVTPGEYIAESVVV